MTQAKEGDTVRVHYTGALGDGTVFDSSEDGEPLQFTIGGGNVVPGFERAVIGMSPGESTVATIPPEEAYGPRHEERVTTLDRDELPLGARPEAGQHIRIQEAGGRGVIAKVIAVSDTSVTLDANHPLAGQDLTFEIRLVEIV